MQYAPFASDIDFAFFSSLAHHKINYDKLDAGARRVLGLYEIKASDAPANSCRMQIHPDALTSDDVPQGYYRAEGYIRNVNTIEEFRKANYNEILQKSGRTIWEAILDGSIYSIPSLLASFTVLSFADLKKYHFHYFCGFPALHASPSWTPSAKSYHLTSDESASLVEEVQTWRYASDARQHGFFLARRVKDNEDTMWKIGSLGDYERGFFDGAADREKDCFVAFADSSNFEEHPSWPLRNLLVLIRRRWGLNKVTILGYRDTHAQRHAARSVVWTLQTADEVDIDKLSLKETMPKVTGWERDKNKKLLPRMADLGQMMDPKKLAESSVDLNNKLMRWRIAPTLDLEKIQTTRCLLLGAGTLGSYVARILMGWGVRKITFVDNAKISYSNPVRQPLFKFEDCQNGGKDKATTAAEALKEIFPGVQAEGYKMNVPMAGHPLRDKKSEEEAEQDYEKLKQLFLDHDAIFLLMDTRESRWLPTLMGKHYGKIVMNAALGFDSFVVMRHGVQAEVETEDDEKESTPEKETPPQSKEEVLGCYFCNDVVAPGDSLTDRTLDQMCTVTRPGIAPVASGLLVEMLMSILQHPQGPAAPAAKSADDTKDRDATDHPLGIVPHQIRGFLGNFQNKVIHSPAYEYCSACSDRILSAYEEGGWEFVKRAMNEEGYVEKVSGLEEVQRTAAAIAEDGVDWDDDEEGDKGDGEGELV